MFVLIVSKMIVFSVFRRFVSNVNNNAPLRGIKVIDMTRIFSGPVCTLALADFGAEIYKIETPKTGDDTRSWPPFIKDSFGSCSYIAWNRNKKSVCVNFKTIEGQRILYNLAQVCDVLVENYIPGTLRKYHLDYESLSSVAPHLIYCTISGFGSLGPYSKRPGVDLIAASMSGHLHLTGPEGGEPCRSSTSTIDIMAGLRAHGAILAALYNRKTSGKGCKIDVDLFTTGLVALSNYLIANLSLNIEPKRMGTEHPSVVPYKSFQSKDGYITIGAINDTQFNEFCEKVSVPELIGNEKFKTANARAQNRKELIAVLMPIFLKKTTKEWCEIFEKSCLPHGPLNTIGQVVSDPHVKAIDIIKEVEYPSVGRIKILDSPVTFSDYQNEVKSPPSLGQHTEAVLKDVLNYSDEKIQELKRKNVI